LVIVIIIGGILVGISSLSFGLYGSNVAGTTNDLAQIPGGSNVPVGQGTPSTVTEQGGVTTVMMTETALSSTASGPATIPLTTVTASSTGSSNPNTLQAAPSQPTNHTGFIEFFSNVTVQVSSPQSALDKATAIAYTYGGYLAYSSYENTSSIAVMRIPAANYGHALSAVEGLGNLTGMQATSNDVSIKYSDLNATLQSLLTEEASLLRLENRSSTLNSTILLENQIQGINTQINEIQSQILQTRLLIDYSTITATFSKHIPTPPPTTLSLKLVATPQSGMSPLAVTFNAIVSGGIAPYISNYNFGDGSSYQGQTLIHTYYAAGSFNATVTITDSNGTVRQAFVVITVTNPPASATASQFTSFASYVGGLLVSVVEGIIEVAVVVLPIALVIGAVIYPFRNRLKSTNKEVSK
jgi:hypothetical protein